MNHDVESLLRQRDLLVDAAGLVLARLRAAEMDVESRVSLQRALESVERMERDRLRTEKSV